MRELGKRIELQDFEYFCEDRGYDSVQRTIAGVFYRFFCDVKCPAIFVKLPRNGDEVVPGLRWNKDFGLEPMLAIASNCARRCHERYKYETEFDARQHGEIMVITKKDFSEGRWDEYGYEYAGKNGISIPS